MSTQIRVFENKSKSAEKVKALRITTTENGGPRSREMVMSCFGSARFRLSPYSF
jgi:hypothetical protein